MRRALTFWDRWASVILLVGALAWLAKISVIVATDGRVDSTGFAAVFFLGGAALMALGASAVGLWLTRGRRTWLRVVVMVFSVFGFFVSFVILDSLAKPTLGELGPSYMKDEAGILATALFWLFVAGALVRLRRTSVPAAA